MRSNRQAVRARSYNRYLDRIIAYRFPDIVPHWHDPPPPLTACPRSGPYCNFV